VRKTSREAMGRETSREAMGRKTSREATAFAAASVASGSCKP